MNEYIFSGPHNITLELKHVVPKRYEDYNNILTIRRNYSVALIRMCIRILQWIQEAEYLISWHHL